MTLTLITRAREKSELIARVLEKKGFKAHICPLIKIETFPPPPPIKDAALILTSANAAHCIKPFLKSTPIYTVGDQTKKACMQLGFKNVVSASGNIFDLLNLVKSNAKKHPSFLYLRGKDVAYPLEKALKAQGVHLSSYIGYTTSFLTDFPPSTLQLLKSQEITSVLLFSQKTAEQFEILAIKNNIPPHNVTMFLFSPKIASNLRLSYKKVLFPPKPSMEYFLDLVFQEIEG